MSDQRHVSVTDVECPVCGAWVGWACEGPNYGYHATGYHPSRQRAAEHRYQQLVQEGFVFVEEGQ